MKSVKLGTGLAFWGDTLRPAIDMVERADIQYLCCDHLAELTMAILSKQKDRRPDLGYTTDIVPFLKGVLPKCVERGIKIISNAGGANPESCTQAVVELCKEMGYHGLKVATVTGDDIMDRVDDLLAEGIELTNLDTGRPLSDVRDKITQANVYIGAEVIVEALEQGADIVICGRVTDSALFLGPMRYELGWEADDWEKLGPGAGVAHCIECGGQATGGLEHFQQNSKDAAFSSPQAGQGQGAPSSLAWTRERSASSMIWIASAARSVGTRKSISSRSSFPPS